MVGLNEYHYSTTHVVITRYWFKGIPQAHCLSAHYGLKGTQWAYTSNDFYNSITVYFLAAMLIVVQHSS